MASVTLKNIKKIYPNAQKKKKKGEPEKKSNLKITAEGVVAVEDFNLEIADKNLSYWLALPAAGNLPHCVWLPVWKRSAAGNCSLMA